MLKNIQNEGLGNVFEYLKILANAKQAKLAESFAGKKHIIVNL